MDQDLVRYLVTGAFAMHGIGMIGAAGYLPFDRKGSFIGASWLLGSGAAATVLGVLIWGIAGAGFAAAAWGFWNADAWWRSAAAVGSIATIIACVVWVGKIPVGVYVGGLLAAGTLVYLVLS